MKGPLDRDQQIELMRGAQERQRARSAKRLADVAVREVVSRPLKQQLERSSYWQRSDQMACCA
jgi:hypothetical protein